MDEVREKEIKENSINIIRSIYSKLKSHVDKSFNNYNEEYGKDGALDTLYYVYFYVYLTGDEESFDNDDYLWEVIYDLKQENENILKIKTKEEKEYFDFCLWFYTRELIREYFSNKYLNDEYIISNNF